MAFVHVFGFQNNIYGFSEFVTGNLIRILCVKHYGWIRVGQQDNEEES